MAKILRKGYTTGVHTSFAFIFALQSFMATKTLSKAFTHKMDNDDLDVTKGCEIVVTISDKKKDLKLNKIAHKPYIIGSLELYAGIGVGVVSKEGLKPPKGYPAINPTPLQSIANIYSDLYKEEKTPLYCSVSVTDGEELAKQTANAKVGVLGGISILGTTGFVKPVSADAYLDSIRTELGVAKANGYNQAILTLGNSSFTYAKEHYDEMQIVEIGNFVYDALEIVDNIGIEKAIFICGIGKASKVMQGCKNTHNRFGSIDFVDLQEQIFNELEIWVDIEITKTVKGISLQLKELNLLDEFYAMIKQKTEEKMTAWFENLNIEVKVLK